MAPKSPKKNPKYDPSKRERKQSSRQSQNVVYVLSEFALELMRILEAFNTENFQSDGKLRIGANFIFSNEKNTKKRIRNVGRKEWEIINFNLDFYWH